MGAARNQNNAKIPPGPTASGPGGQNTNNAKKPRRDPTVPQRYRGSSAGRISSERNYLTPPGPTAIAVRTRGARLMNGGSGHGGNGHVAAAAAVEAVVVM